MIRRFLSLAACTALVAGTAAAVSAQTVPAGSYQQSCTNVRVRGNMLVASCTNSAGQAVRSRINLGACSGDIANVNGQLTCNGSTSYGNGSYHSRRHHHHGHAYGNNNSQGDNDNDRDNNHGYGNGRYSAAINGSYQQSCTNIRTRGSVITASCTTPNGGSNTSTLDARTCNGGDIINRNGSLACG